MRSRLRAFRRRLDDAQLVERRKDDPRCRPELWLEHLDHCDLGGVKLQNPSPSTGGRIVNTLNQLDDVEGGNLVSYCHFLSMLGGRVGRDQSWRRYLDGVMPRDQCPCAAVINCQGDLDSAGNAVRRSLANLFDHGAGRCFCDRPPDTVPVSGIDMKYTRPFVSVSLCSKDPLQLALLKPDACSAREGLAGFRWPRHGLDARDQNFMRVRRRSILRVINRTRPRRSR